MKESYTVSVGIVMIYPVLCIFLVGFFFFDRLSLCIPGFPGTHSVGQARQDLRNPPISVSQFLRLKTCATTANHYISICVLLSALNFYFENCEFFTL